jgi:HAD superfamily hydrolase (TIGR01509 family)
MDGVLADTGEFHYQSWVVALTEVGIPFDRHKFRKIFGMNNAAILAILLGSPPESSFLVAVSERKEALFRQMIRCKVHPMAGVRTWLEQLSAIGYRHAVASSAPQANIDALVDELQIRPYFAALVSAYNLPSKPDPAVFLEAARQLGISPHRCIVIEDAVHGVSAAQHAGMKCIAVTTTHLRPDLAEADVIVDSLEQLMIDDFKI